MQEMNVTTTLPPITTELKHKYEAWWNQLSTDWRKAFNEVCAKRGPVDMRLSDEAIHEIFHAFALRFAGPSAQYPNMTFELDNLDGILGLDNLSVLVVISQNITSLSSLKNFKGQSKLQSLFVFDNQFSTLDGVQYLKNLENIYFQGNKVVALNELRRLSKLKVIYCTNNKFQSLKGIGRSHKALEKFHVMPNENLPQKEIMRFERRYGIRCLNG